MYKEPEKSCQKKLNIEKQIKEMEILKLQIKLEELKKI